MIKYKISDKYSVYSSCEQILEKIKKDLIANKKKYYKFLHPEWIHYLKNFEIELMSSNLKKNQKILEIGSGEGYVAKILRKDLSFDVTASDLEPRFPQYTDVLKMDSQATEFRDKEYDAIISFHVLEHIEDIDKAMQEFSRLLKDDGVMYHIVPTRTNMFFTIILQPIAYIRGIYLFLNGYMISRYQPFEKKNILSFFKKIILSLNPVNIFWGSGHGVYNRKDCFKYWSIENWTKVYEKNRFEVISVENSSISNSMHKLFPFKFLKIRRFLAKKGFSSSKLFIVKKVK